LLHCREPVALLLAFRGAEVLPAFIPTLFLIGAVVLFLFQPLLVGSRSLPVPLLEALVVLVDAAVIKLPVALNPFPGRRLSWRRLGALAGYLGRRQYPEPSGRLHRHAQAMGDGDGLVGPDALKLISSSSPSEATSKPNISTAKGSQL
jgi:hypothetical protein